MKKFIYSIIASLLILSGIFIYELNKPPQYEHPRQIRYSFTVQNTTNQLLTDAEVWVYGPVKQTSWQLTRSITSDNAFVLEKDAVGNQILHFHFSNFPPFATKVVTVSAIVMLADKPQRDLTHIQLSNYLHKEKYLEIDNPQLIKLAKQIKRADSTLKIAQSNFNWVSSNIKYAGFIKDDRGALYAYNHRSGDCTEYMYLYIALNRINGIPARGVGGYRIKDNSVVVARDYHNWAESFIDNKWRVVDPQNKNFLNDEDQYIAFRIFSSKNNKLTTNTHRFAITGNGLVLHMN